MPTPRKELSTHKLQGTKAKYIEETSVVAPGRPRFPKNLSPDSKRFFKNLCRMLEQRRTLTEGDQELIRLAAILRDRHERAMAHVLAEGEICVYCRLDSNGAAHDMWKENLWLRCAKDAEKQMVAILDRLGLTPLARGKVKQTEIPKESTVDPRESAMFSREAEQPPVEQEIDLNSIDETVVQ